MMAVIAIAFFSVNPATEEADAQALLMAKQAYVTAQAYFTECGGAKADVMTLIGLGLPVSSEISLEITDGKPETLGIRTSHVKGGLIYDIDSRGNIKASPRGRIARLLSRFLRPPEPSPPKFQQPYLASGYSDHGSATRMAARNAYNAAEYFFASNPDGTFGRDNLGSYCTNRDDGVIIEILNGRRQSLRIRARHPESGVVWEADENGRIISPAQAAKTEPPGTVLKQASKDEIQAAADEEARETAGKVYSLSRSYLSEYMPTGGLSLGALKRAYPSYSIPPDVTVDVLDRRDKTLKLKVWHKEGSRVFEVDPEGLITAKPLS